MKATARLLIVAVTICSWIAISNHCALRAFTAKSETNSACPFHSKPAKQKPTEMECCKNLRATPPVPAKNLAPAIINLFPVDNSYRQLAILEPPEIFVAHATLDTGPPGKTSFAELNRSLRAHAPPFFG